MGQKLTLRYDREGDILYIDKREPYAEQDSDDLGDEVIARLNPVTREIENLEILFFTARLSGSEALEVPVAVDLRRSEP